MKFRNRCAKYILKKMLLDKKLVPAKVVNRPKKGFGIPIGRWINNNLKALILDYLGRDAIRNAGIFDHKYVEQILREHFSSKKDNRKLIWTLFMFQLWKDTFNR